MKGRKFFLIFKNNFPELKVMSLQNEKTHQVPSTVVKNKPIKKYACEVI